MDMHTHNHVCIHTHIHTHTHLWYLPLNCRGEWCVIDWKTSRKPRPKLGDMYDAPLQVCAYIGAVNQDERYPVKVGGHTAHIHCVLDGSVSSSVSSTCAAAHSNWSARPCAVCVGMAVCVCPGTVTSAVCHLTARQFSPYTYVYV